MLFITDTTSQCSIPADIAHDDYQEYEGEFVSDNDIYLSYK